MSRSRATYWLFVAKTYPLNAVLFILAGVLLIYAVSLRSLSHLVVAIIIAVFNLGLVYAERHRRQPRG